MKPTKEKLIPGIFVAVLLTALFVLWYSGVFFERGFGRDTSASDRDVRVYCFNVGQGDSTLLCSPKATVLIDAGTDASEEDLYAYLLNLGIRQIDLAIFTHPDGDHIGGADRILSGFSVGKMILPKGDIMLREDEGYLGLIAAAEEYGVPLEYAAGGDSFTLDCFEIGILAPNRVFYDELNDYSITARVAYGETSFLFTGDAGVVSEEEMLERYGEHLKSTVYHVGHHGALTSSSELFLEAVSPQYAVISCGKGNTYGHPRTETLDKLEAGGVTVLRTDELGTVVLISDGRTVRIGRR